MRDRKGFKEVKPSTEYWKPKKEGEEILGVLLPMEEDRQDNEVRPIQCDDGRKLWLPRNVQLDDKLENIVEGERVLIVYDGTAETSNNRTVKKFAVYQPED